jgi:signal transduction histidine kinase
MPRNRREPGLPATPSAFDEGVERMSAPEAALRYVSLIEKYRSLVHKYRAEGEGRHSVYKLALWALRNRTSGLALVHDDRATVLNDRMREMEQTGSQGSWISEPPDGRRRYSRLRDLVIAESRALQRRGGPSAVQRFGWAGGSPERYLEVYLDRAEGPGLEGTFALVHDVTEQVRIEREHQAVRAKLQQHDRLHVLGLLASSIAHDFNNSFFAIRLQLESLIHTAENATQRTRLQELLELLHGEAGRIRSLQDLARQRRELPAEAIDLVPVIRDAARLVEPHLAQGHKRVALRIRAPRSVLVQAHAGEVRDAVLNLLINASDAIAERGEVRVALGTRAGVVRLVVDDTGSGIDKQHLPRIFDPFFTTKAGRGTGQGLATLPGMMARLGGSVVARNRSPRGASFVLTFPRTSAPVAPPLSLPPARLTRPCAVLVVEDDARVRASLERTLARHRLVAVASAEKALAVLRRKQPFDVVICDLDLPGMDGWELASTLVIAKPRLPVVIVSGLGATISAEVLRPPNVRRVLTKPVGVAELEGAIAEAVGSGV